MKIRKGNVFEKCISVTKSRGQDHLNEIYPYSIKEGGLNVYTKEIPFSLIGMEYKEGK